MLLLIKSSFNLLVLGLSLTTLSLVLSFVSSTESLTLASAPKALLNLQEIFLPPLINLQVFVFVFDLLVAVYYIYNFPVWDKIKARFVYFQYESKPVERQDCSNLFLQTLFILLSKVRFELNLSVYRVSRLVSWFPFSCSRRQSLKGSMLTTSSLQITKRIRKLWLR